MYLFFDTETTGLPRNWRAPVTDLTNWPRLVQLACLLYNQSGDLLQMRNFIVKPDSFIIPEAAARIHGISTERAMAEGVALQQALSEFVALANECKYLVAHNMSFDEMIVGAELHRVGMQNVVAAKAKICTMKATTDFCRLPGPYGYKWPKLSELHHKLFATHFDEAHNAAVDIIATAKCFWELKKMGAFARAASPE